MGKYSDLIDGLMKNGRYVHANREPLVEADGRAMRPLITALANHKDETIRELCAEILGERDSPKAIPALIAALQDDSLSVRQDAQWSIESICKYQSGALGDWLDLNPSVESDNHAKVQEWWATNKKYIENNYHFDF